MNSKKIKIAMVATNLDLNGISSVVMNICRYIDKQEFQLTLFVGTPIDNSYRKECQEYGIEVVELPFRKKNMMSFYYNLYKKLGKAKYDIFHIHGNSSIIAIDLAIAKIRKIRHRAAHCHNCKSNSLRVHKLLLPFFNRLYTHGFACSTLAGEWLFKNNEYLVIPNGFEMSNYLYREQWRKEIRDKLHINDEFLLGHVGRFNGQKNQEYLLKILEKLVPIYPDIRLLFIGNGPDHTDFLKSMENYQYCDNVVFVKETTEIGKYYSAMDMFLFPSFFEGFGMVMTEAQASGLSCIASEAVPKDVVISNNVCFLPIDENSIDLWCQKIQEVISEYDLQKRTDIDFEQAKRFDIKNNIKLMANTYHKMMKS